MRGADGYTKVVTCNEAELKTNPNCKKQVKPSSNPYYKKYKEVPCVRGSPGCKNGKKVQECTAADLTADRDS